MDQTVVVRQACEGASGGYELVYKAVLDTVRGMDAINNKAKRLG